MKGSRASILNFILNLWWTIVCFAPLLVFWFLHYQQTLFLGQLLLSGLFLFLPESAWVRLQISNDKEVYERLGVRAIQAVTQNGKLINHLAGTDGKPRRTIRRRSDLVRLRRQIVMYERYHLFCLVFFFSTMATAVVQSRIGLAALILISNLLYNVYPLLIQQYNRIRSGGRKIS